MKLWYGLINVISIFWSIYQYDVRRPSTINSLIIQSIFLYLYLEITDANTRIYKSTDDSLGACDVCNFSLTLNSADGKAMSTTGK